MITIQAVLSGLPQSFGATKRSSGHVLNVYSMTSKTCPSCWHLHTITCDTWTCVVLDALSDVDVDVGLFRFMFGRIIQALPPGGLAHFPKLEYLWFIFDILDSNRMHADDGGTNTDDVINTLVERLDSEAPLTLARRSCQLCASGPLAIRAIGMLGSREMNIYS